MANFRILPVNIVDLATVTDNPAMLATLPVTNAARQTEREKTARTTGLASQDLKLTWAANRRSNMLAATRHNLTTAGTLRGLGYSDAAWTTGILDTGALAAFDTTGLDTQRDDYTARDFRGLKTTVLYHALQTTLRSAIARMTDGANPDGYMEITRLWMGEYFEAGYNPAYGALTMQPMDASTSERADDGTHLVNKLWRARKLTVDMAYIEDADVPSWLAIARLLGLSTECFIDIFPGVATAEGLYHRGAFRVVQVPSMSPRDWGVHGLGQFVFEET
jgi:hypothetical protein